MRALPSWVKGFVYSCLCIFTLAQTGFGQGPAAASAYGKLPLSFEPNRGQTAGEVQFLSRGRGYTLFLSSSDSVLALHRRHPGSRAERTEAGPSADAPAALRMHLVGANPSAQGVAEDALPGKSNYFIGNERTKWRTNIPNYGRVRYRGVYPGIDLVYYGNQRLLEHDFEVAPGADPRRIRLAFAGIQRAAVEKSGDLVLQLADGEVRLQKPVIYQNTEQGRREVTGGFALRKNQVTIQVGAYDRRRALVIDPILSYSTYLGGTGEDAGSAVATDSSGNVYVVGLTASTAANGFPITTQLSATGCAAVTPAGCSGTTDDVFIVKINPSGTGGTAGTALVYSTFLGGDGDDEGYGISVDGSNNAYVTGFTSSTDFPLSTSPAPYQPTIGSFQGSAFVTKIGPVGNTLLYSTYLGGHARDWGNAITQDSGGNIYVTGVAFSRDFPTLSTLSASPVTLFASRNSGTSWVAASGSTSFQVTAFAVDRNTPGTVYAGQVGSGVIKSTDFGATWTATVATQSYSNALVLDPTTTGAAAVLYEGSRFNGVRKITGGGTGSTLINSGLTSFNVLSLVLDPASNATLYASLGGRGVWVTTSANGPTPTWTQVTTTGLGDQTINALAFDSATHALYAGTNNGVYQLANGAASWTTVAGGPTGLSVLALAIDSSSNVYAASFGGGLFKLSAGAWTTLNGSGGTALGTLNLRAVAVDPVTVSTIYAAGRSRLGIYKSTDGGSTWSLLNSGLTITSAQTLAIDPASTGNVYVGMVNLMSFVAKFNSGGSPTALAFFGGASGSTQPYTMAVDDPTSQNMYIGGSTSTASLPTPLVGQTTIGGNTDGFVAKISTVGTPAVVWDRYLGGAFDDIVFSLALDQNRNVDVTGYTTSADFPVSAGAYQSSLKVTPNFAANAFVSEIDPTGATLLYSTYFGGTGGDDEGTGIAVVSAGNVASINVTDGGGGYLSTAPPAVAISGGGGSGAAATAVVSPASGQVTGFVITNPGSGYVLAPTVGIALPSGPGTPATAQAVLSSPLTPLVSVAGLTVSTDLPTVNAMQAFNAGGYDTFYARFDPSKIGAAGLLYSTYLGGNSDDFAFFLNNLALDSLGAAWITGQTYSTNFPTTASSAVQPAGSSTVANSGDAFVYKIQTTGNASDISLSMSSGAGATPAEGTTYVYSIVVTDNGPNAAGAPSVVVSGAMPTNLTVNSVIAGQGTCSGLQSFTCSLGTVAFPGAGVDITVNVTANTVATPPVGPTMTATARVATADDDLVPANNAASLPVTVQRQADLRITGISSPSSVAVGSAFSYSVTAFNNGPSTATGIIVSYPLPANVTFNAGSPTSAGCALSAGTVTCPVVNLTPFSSTAIVINVTPNTPGQLSATFTVSSSQVVDDGPGGGPGANNTPPPFTLTVRSNVNLSLTTATTLPVVPVGGSAAFNITVTNNGTDTATGVSFTGSSATGLSYVSFSSSSAGVSCSAAEQVSCTLPDIPSLGTVSFTIFARAALQGTYVANASVSSSVTDANPSDNATSTTVTVVGALGSNLTTLLTDYETSTVQSYSGYPNPGPIGQPTQVGASPSNVVIAPNGRLAFTGNVNGSYISVVDLTIQAEIARIRDVGGWSIAITSDGQKLVSVSSNRDELDVVDIATLAVTRISLDGKVGDAAGVNDIHPFSLAVVGFQAYIANAFGPVIVVNFTTPASPGITTVAGTAALLQLHAGHQVAATPDGSTVAVFDRLNTGGSALVYLISTATHTLSQTVTTTFGGARTIAITPNPNAASGVVAFLGFTGGAIRVLDLRSGSATYGQLLTGSVALGSSITDMALTPDGNTLQAVDGVFRGSTGPPSTLYTLNAALIVTSPSTALVSTVAIPNSLSVRGLAIGYVQNFPLSSAPQVTDVVPQEITNEAAKLVRIFGDNFIPGALVRIGNLDPLPSTFVSPQEVTVTVPAGAAVQLGGIVVTLPNTASGALAAHVSGGGSFGGGRLQIDPPLTFAPSHPVALSGYGVPKLSLLFRDSALLPGGPFSPGIAISPDGLYAYSGLAEVDVTNLDTQQSLPPILGPTSGSGTQTFYDCAGGSDNYAIAPDPTTGKKVLYLVSCDAATETSDTLYIVDVDPTSTTTRNTLLARTIQAPNTDFFYSQGLAVTPDGRFVYSVDARNVSPAVSRLVIFDVLNSTSTIIADITTLGADPTQQHIHVAPDGHSLLLSGTGGSSIKVYDIQGANALAPALVATITGSGAPTANPPLLYWFQVVGARLFAYASDQRYVQVFNFDRATPNFTALGAYTIPSPAGRFAGAAMAVTPEGALIYALLENEDAVAVLDANLVAASSPNSLITKMRTLINPANLAFSPRGNATADLDVSINTSATLLPTTNTYVAALNQSFDVFMYLADIGPSTSTGVNMTLSIPAGVVVNSASVINGPFTVTCTITTTQVTCPVGMLRTFDSITVDVNVTATALGSLLFTNTVSGNELDPNPANNAATLNVTVANGADLAITGSASPNPAVAGSPDTGTVVVTNNGPDVASAVSAVLFSSANSFLSSTTTQGTCVTEISVVCNLGNIAPGGSVTITATATFVASNASTTGTVNFSGFVSASTADPNSSNNFFSLNLPLTNPSTPLQRWLVGDRETSQFTTLDYGTNTQIGQTTSAGVDPIGIAISPNRHIAFVANQNSFYISVVDLSIQQEIYRIRVTDQLGPRMVAVSPDGTKLLATFITSDRLWVFDAVSFNQLLSVNLDGQFGDVVGANDRDFAGLVVVGSKAYVAASDFTGDATGGLGVSTPVAAVDINTGAISTVSGLTGYGAVSRNTINPSNALAATPDGQFVIAARQFGSAPLQLINTATNSVTQTIAATTTDAIGVVVGSGTASPAGTFGYAALNNALVVVDLRNGSPTFGQLLSGRSVTLPVTPEILAISPDGTRLYATLGLLLATTNAVVVDTSVLVTGANPATSIILQTHLGGTCSSAFPTCPSEIRSLAAGYVDTLPESGAPVITGVSPSFNFNDVPNTITISGSGFAPDARVRVGKIDNLPVTFLSSSQLQVTIPKGAPAHGNDVVVTNPNASAGLTGQLLSAFLRGGVDNGGLEISSPLAFQPKFQAVVSEYGAASIEFLQPSGGGNGRVTGIFDPMGIAFTPDGSGFFAESFGSSSVLAGSVGTPSPNTRILLSGVPGQYSGLAVAPNPSTGTPVAYVSSAFSSGSGASRVAGVQLYAIDANPASPALNSILFTIAAGVSSGSTQAGALAATADGRYVYQTITDGKLVIFDTLLHTATVIPQSTLGTFFVAQATVSPDGRSLLLNDDTNVLVFDISANPLAPTLVTKVVPTTPPGSASLFFDSQMVVGNHLYAWDSVNTVLEIFNFNRAANDFSFINYFVASQPNTNIGYFGTFVVTPDESLAYLPLKENDSVVVVDVAKLISGGVQGDPTALVTAIATAQGPQTIALSPKRRDTAPQDVGIAISHTPEPVPLGSNITYNVTVSDFGPFPGSGNGDSGGSDGGFLISFDKTLIPISTSFSNSPFVQCSLFGSQLLCGFSSNAPDLGPPPVSISGTLVLQTTVPGAVTVQGYIKADNSSYDPNPANNTATDTANVVSADLGVTMTAAPATVAPGANLAYTIVVTNNGPTASSGYTLTDTLPANVTFVSATSGCVLSTVLTCSGPSLGVGLTASYVVVVTPTVQGTLINNVSVAGNEFDPVPGNNSAATTTNAVAVDLGVTKTASAATVALGADLTYTITVTNNGPSASTGYTVTDPLPSNVTFVSATSGCVLTTVLTCSGPGLGVEQSATYVVVVTPTALGTLSNTASVTGNEPDTVPGNNSATSTVTAAAAVADVAVTMTASPSPVAVLGSVTYQITLTNNGPSPATGVVLTDTLPVGALFASIDDRTDCAVSNGVLTCNFASLAAGSSTTVNLILVPLVVPSAEGTFTNTATVIANEPDPALANNSAAQTVPVTGANLSGGGALRNPPGFSNTITSPNDDGSFGPVPLGFNLNFFGTPVSSLFVNNNGNVTFGTPLGTYTPFPLTSTNLQIVAPYFSDVGTYQTGSGLVTYGADTVNGRPAFGVNWPNVDYFGEGAPDLLNLFQLVLVDRSDVNAGDFDIELNYDKIQWETGDASGGSGGLGGSSARVGYSNGTGATGSYFELPGSGVPGSFLDSNTTTGLIYNTLNSAQPGRYLFQVRNGVVQSSADLAITATGPQFAAPGSTVTYSLTAVNLGPNTATGVTVTDTLPVGFTFVSATPGAICPTPPTPAAGQPVVVTCNVGSIASGSTVDISIQATIPSGVSGSLTDTAVVSAPNNQDLNLGNNTATVVTNANVADLAVIAAGAPSPVGGFPAFAATVTNNGPADATNVVLTDLLDNYGFVSASSTQGACSFTAPTVTCSLGTLANGASAVVTVAVIAPNAGWAANTYHASAAQPDPNPINNAFRLGPSPDSFNTPVGTNVAVNISDPADNLTAVLTFSRVTRIGSTTITSMSATSPPPGFRSGRQPTFFDTSTNAEYVGAIAFNIHFVPANFRHPALVRLFHFEGGTWVDRTTGLDVATGVIAGQVMSLSPFALLEPVDTIPVANAGGDRSVPGAMAAGARVTLDGSASVDADGDPLTYRWSGPFPEGGGTVTGINPTVTLALGVSKVSLVVNDGEADSPAVAANVAVADFQVSALAGSVALTRGQSTTFTITMTPQYGAFGAPINLSCAPGAADVTCSFSSASVTPGAAAATATLTVTAVSTVARAPGRSMPAYIALWFGTLPVFGVVFLAAGRRKKWQMAVLLALLLVLVASHIGCGGGGGTTQTQSSSSSTPGAKAITIIVTGTSGTLQHSSSVTVTIPQ